jgi:hypothetical protein
MLCMLTNGMSNITVKLMSMLLHIEKVTGLRVGSEAEYRDWGLSCFSSVITVTCPINRIKS